MGVRARSFGFVLGTAGRRIGWNDQNARSSSVMPLPLPISAGSGRAIFAPAAIHFLMSAIWSAREFLFAPRHLAAVHHREEQALVRLARNDHRAIVAALEHEPAQAQVDSTFQFLAFAVAIETVRLEDGADVFLERRRGSRSQVRN